MFKPLTHYETPIEQSVQKPVSHITVLEAFTFFKNSLSCFNTISGDTVRAQLNLSYPALVENKWNWDKEFFDKEFAFFLEHGRVRTKGERRAEIEQQKKEAEKMKTYTYSSAAKDWILDKAFPPVEASYDYNTPISFELISLDPFNRDPAPTPKEENKTGDNPMYFHFNTSTPIENQQIEFAFQYAREAYEEASSALRAKYHIDEPEGPKDAEEFIERIKAGKYTLMDKDTSKYFYEFTESYDGDYSLPKRLRWRTEKADQDGYDAALDALSDEFTKLKATIMANDYKASIDAVDAFAKKHTVH